LEELEERLADPATEHAQVFGAIMNLLSMRQRQAAFHPNATQFTLHLGETSCSVSGARVRIGARASSASAISATAADTAAARDQSDRAQDWSDLISGEDCNGPFMQLEPYRTVWITNRRDHRQAHP
jgi:sucrose phosphorylase